MERQRKERLVGAAVLVMLAVIFIPMVLDDTVQPESGISGTNIPPQPEGEFTSRVVPLEPGGTPVPADPAPPTAGSAPVAVDGVTPPLSGDTGAGSVTVPVPAPNPAPAPAPAPTTTGTAPAASPTPGSTPAAGTAPAPEADVSAWVVQLGSFSDEANASALNKKLRQAGFSSFVEPLQQGGARVFRVRVGPELRRSAAQGVRDRLKSGMGLDGIVVPYP